MQPKISIVTPSFNQGKYLEQTIISVLGQNYPNIEYIIIDGGSTDESVEIIKKYENQIAYWVSEPDEGQTHAINKGFKKATGELIGWMNSDDIYYPNAFEKIGKIYLETNGEADVIFGDKTNIDEDGNIIREYLYPPFSDLGIKYTTNMNISNQSAFWKRELLESVGYLDEDIQFAMDYEYFLRMALSGAKFHHIDAIIGALRMYDENKSSDAYWLQVKEKNIKEIKNRYSIKDSSVKKMWYYAYKAFHLIKNGNLKYFVNNFGE